ncbi:MAG: response regulator [Chromatiales bacterium]|nr:MAG: response regulator [Chromatiales bacterium]
MNRLGPLIRWSILLILLAAGTFGSRQLSEAFRKDAYRAWIAQADNAGQWLTGTMLNWLEESYAPLSGLAALAEHTTSLTEAEFLDAYDSLESRATTFFLDGAAYLRRGENGEWQITYTTNPYGLLAEGRHLGDQPWLKDTVDEAVDRFGDLIMGPPFEADGRVYSAVALNIQTPEGEAVIVGKIDSTGIVEGLFEIRVPPGMQLQLDGRFLDGQKQRILGDEVPGALHVVTDRTVSAGADLSVSWVITEEFAGGPPEKLARFTLLAGLGGTAVLALFIALLLWRNQNITERVRAATADLAESRERLELALKAADLGVYDYRPQTDEYIVNDRWASMLGYCSADLTGCIEDWTRIAHPDDVDGAFAAFREHVEKKTPLLRQEFRLRAKDGNYRSILSIGKTTDWDDEGAPLRFTGVQIDVTEQKLVEEELRASMERFRLLFEQSFDAHLIFDDNGIVDCNEAAVRLLRYDDKEDLLSHHPSEFSPEFQPDGRRSDEKSLEVDETARRLGHHLFEWMHRKKDGEEFLVEVSMTPVELEGKTAMLGVWHDLTERKQTEDALRAAKDAADAANEAKSAFLANMSHELRTPMNAILGYSEMLMEEAEELEQEDFIPDLKKINSAGTHLLSLINDVLDLSKIESGKMDVFPEEIDLDELIDEVSATAQPLVKKHGNKLLVERTGAGGVICQDITKLRQTLFNLLSNAAKFTESGTVTLRIDRKIEQDKDRLTFAVIDTGIGIPADKLEHIFQEFTQADESTTRDYGGTGLGLAISRRFCQMLGGKLSVESTVGEGSTFTVYVPSNVPGTKLRQATSPQPTTVKAEVPAESAGDAGDQTTILIIDDDPEACEIIGRYLKKDGFAVATAFSGEQGLQLAHELRPTAITLDVMMPEMDGWSVLRALKADPDLREIPVIMLSMIDDRTRGYSLGAVDYLTKPVDREQLHKALERCGQDKAAGGTVLVVEDDAESRELMSRALEKTGWTIAEAGNGREALDLMADQTPALILLDLMMPVMDGFEFLAEIREHPEWNDIPVVVVTAKTLTPEDRARLNGRVEEVVRKSACTREQLLARVREAVATPAKRSPSLQKSPQA